MSEPKSAGRVSPREAGAPRPPTLRQFLSEWRQLGIAVALPATVLVVTAIDHDPFAGYDFVDIVLQSSITAILAVAGFTATRAESRERVERFLAGRRKS